jgi:hypothetical protein
MQKCGLGNLRCRCQCQHSLHEIVRAIERTDDMHSLNMDIPTTHLSEDEIARIRLSVQVRAERKETDKILYAEYIPSFATGCAPMDHHRLRRLRFQLSGYVYVADELLRWRGIHQLESILDDLEIFPKELTRIIKEYVDTKRNITKRKYNRNVYKPTTSSCQEECCKCSFAKGIWRDEMMDPKYGLLACVPAGQDPVVYLKKRFRLRE